MTDLAQQIKALAEKATPQPWHLHATAIGVNPWIACSNGTKGDGEYVRGSCILNMVAHNEREDDAALIVLLRNNVDRIITALSEAERMREALGNATFAAMEFDINRYLIASRRNGAEKAERHRELTETFLRVYAKKWQRRDRDLYTKVHDATQELTNHLDKLGLQADGHYDDDVPRRFHDRFIEIARAAIGGEQP
jgi:hypothetical protein